MKTKTPPLEKPPMGIKPEYIWREERLYELMRAILRYEGKPSREVLAWMEELVRHLTFKSTHIVIESANEKLDYVMRDGCND